MRRLAIAAVSAVLVTLGGCGSSRSVEGSVTDCAACHGFPPTGLAFHETAPGGTWEATECAPCHATSVTASGAVIGSAEGGTHADGKVDAGHATFGDVTGSATDGALHGAAANRGIAACQACHGTALDGGSSGVSCVGCHTGAFAFDNCTLCHGTFKATYTGADLAQAAPPEDVGGASAVTEVTVGAHRAHVAATLASPLACDACHAAIPTSVFDAGHVDGGPAEVPFGAVATTGGRLPAWDRTSATCASTWCHDRGGATTSWSWTSDLTLDCGSCHGNPPASGQHTYHVVENLVDCGKCHTGYGATAVDPAVHVNGAVEAKALNTCHCSGNW